MSKVIQAGIVTAYGAAVRGGYTGTYDKFCSDLAELADVLSEFLGFRVTIETLNEGTQATASYNDGVLALGIPRGNTGNGIQRIEHISTQSLVKTYRITYTSGTYFDFQVSDGNGIDHTTLNADYTLTITYTDGTTWTSGSIRGATGATPNLTIGTVETLLPTQSATATITGTAEDPVLNLGIPKGDTGEVSQAEFDDLSGTVSNLNRQISYFNGNANVYSGRELNSLINTGSWSSASVGSLTITYSPEKIVVNGTANVNAAAFISDTVSLAVGDYSVRTDSSSDTTNIHLRVVSPNASVRYGDSEYEGEQEFSFAESTDTRLIVWIAAGTYNNVILYPAFGYLKPYSNKVLTKKLDDVANDPNVIAGVNITPLDTGSWSGNGITINYNADGSVVVNGTATANSSAFISTAKSIPAGEYVIFDGMTEHDKTIRIVVYTSTAIANSDNSSPGMKFALSESASVRLICWVAGGTTFNNLTLYPCLTSVENMSNEQLSGYVESMIGYTTDEIGKTMLSGRYPWATEEPTAAVDKKIYHSVKSAIIHGGEKGKSYFLRQFMFNSTAFSPVQSYFTIYDGATKVCEYQGIPIKHELQVVHFDDFNNSGITADVEFDFTEFNDNTSTGLATSGIFTFSQNCIEPERKVTILIPDTIYSVVGMETNIYWESAIAVSELDSVIIEVTGNGENLGNRWRYLPTTAGTITFNVIVRDLKYRVLASKTVTVISVVKAVSTAKTLTAIHLGDSMIDNQYHLAHLESDMSDSNITYNIIGTRTYSEGRGGWTSGMYMNASTDPNVPNPFYNPTTQTFDFSYYMQQQGYSGVDVVFVFLGTNDIKGTTQFSGIASSVYGTMKNLKAIVDSIHAYDSTIKVCVEIPAIGAAQQYPYAKMYGNNLIKQSLHKFGIQRQAAFMLSLFSGKESENTYVLPVGNSLDNVNGFPTTEVDASARITNRITVQTDCYHPTSDGYYQFADAEFALIRNKFI